MSTFLQCIFFYSYLIAFGISTSIQAAPRQQDWSMIDTSLSGLLSLYASLPNHRDFLIGVTIAEYQQSGADNCPNSNWAHFEALKKDDGPSYIHNNEKSGIACDFWHRYPQDIELMDELGINACRLSVDWSRIEPACGIWDEHAVEHYKNLCRELLAKNITPMITLHHFVHPIWFSDRGGFEKKENIYFFARFCKKIFTALSPYVQLWCTINEPSVHALQGYMRGAHPPAQNNLPLACTVLKNLLMAHCEVYSQLKSLPNGNEAQIGLVHSYLPFASYHDDIIASKGRLIIEKFTANFMNYVFNDSIIQFLESGTFSIYIPLSTDVTWHAERAGKTYLDFLGLNYYSRVLTRCYPSELLNAVKEMRLPNLEQFINASHYDDEIMTDMPYAMYPQGIYEALMHLNNLGVPLYVTENGIADAQDTNRDTFIRRYLWSMLKAAHDGCDIRGYFYWTLMDNFEWNDGFSMQFGLYHVDFTTQKRTLRQGAYIYRDFACASRTLREIS